MLFKLAKKYAEHKLTTYSGSRELTPQKNTISKVNFFCGTPNRYIFGKKNSHISICFKLSQGILLDKKMPLVPRFLMSSVIFDILHFDFL